MVNGYWLGDMDEEFDKWAEKKASEWVNGVNELRKRGKFLGDNALRYIIIKALREGRAYGKNDVEK